MRSLALLLIPLAIAPAAAQQTPAADSTRVYELTDVEVLPRPQNAQEFAAALARMYPPHLRDAGVSGTAHLAFVVAADGRVGDVRVMSATDSAFATPSVQAASLLRFAPAQVQGRPVAVRVEQPIQWRVAAPAVAAPAAAEADFTGTGAPEENGYELEEVEELPRLLNPADFSRALAQRYPPVLRDAATSGVVQVRFRIAADGTISHPRITRVTNTAFIEPTLAALEVLRFRPARLNGRPVAVWVEQPIEWRVSRDPAPNAAPNADRPRDRSRSIMPRECRPGWLC